LKKKFALNTTSNPPLKTSLNPGKTSEVNVVQTTATDKASKGKNKAKGKETSDTPKHDPPKSFVDDISKCKPQCRCLICQEDHYTKDCPRRAEVSCLLKGTQGNPNVLKDPFPSQ